MRRWIFLSATLLLLLFLWHWKSQAPPSGGGGRELVVLLPPPRAELLPLYRAVTSGRAEKEGLRLKLVTSPHPTPGKNALAALRAEEVLYARALRGKKWRIVALISERELAWLAGSRAFRWEDVRQQRVITPAGEEGLSAVFEEALRERGWRPHQEVVLISNLPPHLHRPAFKAGVGSLLLTSDPLILTDSFHLQPFSSPALPRWGLVAEEGSLTDKEVEALQRLLRESAEEIYSESPAFLASEITAFFPQLSLTVLTRALEEAQQQEVWARNPLPDPSLWEKLQEILKRAGELPRPLEYREIFTPAPRPWTEEGNK
ncbi:hypothetical protein [Desulfothermobacter acidiphilus]|uniref:hypothetical protein n=1 Tax=Desulfothermobacter acidiphilus TaxID=1938353 RepID=UPI003F895F9E